MSFLDQSRFLFIYNGLRMCAVGLVLSVTLTGPGRAAGVPATDYGQPRQAVDALLAAVRDGTPADIERILGSRSKDLISSGDTVSDRAARDRFVAAYDEKNAIVAEGDRRALLMLGSDAWPFAMPLIKSAHGWRFDAAAGRTEILNRRIGRNELNAIEVCRTYVEAQNAYIGGPRLDAGLPAYAQNILSTPGTHDGLYWPAAADGEESPLGPLLASARADGYELTPPFEADHTPYHGYFFKILTRQGRAAPGGAHDYIVDGKMIGGFALIAFPARYGDSGIMSFIVNHDGIVYQRNLGPHTLEAARRIASFDPDHGWEKPRTAATE